MIILDNVIWLYQHYPMRFDCKLAAGEKVAILGPSGSGKSTFLNLIAGFLPLHKGNLWLHSAQHNKTSPEKRPISMLFQENNLFLHLTVAENIGLGLHPGLRLTSVQKANIKNIAQQMGIDDILHRMPSTLSGGQRQRTALARCLIRQQPILLLDEPFSALDSYLRATMIRLLNDICAARKLTLLIVSHDLDDIFQLAPRTLLIVHGEIFYDGPTIQLVKGTIPESIILGVNLEINKK